MKTKSDRLKIWRMKLKKILIVQIISNKTNSYKKNIQQNLEEKTFEGLP